MAIAAFYAVATAIGGISGPVIFGQLIGAAEETGTRVPLLYAYLIGAGFMIFAAIIQMILGVRAEQKSLESIAAPLTAIKEETGPA